MSTANALRGEAVLQVGAAKVLLRPTFQALVAAEEELGSLFELVDRAASGKLKIAEVAVLFDHLSRDRPAEIDRQAIGDAVIARGLANVTPALRILLGQILQGA